MEQAVNGSQGYRCQCMPGEVDMGGLCLVPGSERYPLSTAPHNRPKHTAYQNKPPLLYIRYQCKITEPIVKEGLTKRSLVST